MRYSKGMSFVHHFLRVIWANIGKFFVWDGYKFAHIFSKKVREVYKANLEKWNKIDSFMGLVSFFQNDYKYKWDGPKGIFDHNNSKLEFFTKFGDCDDVGFYACKKLKEIYKDNIEECFVIGFAQLDKKFWHYDCCFKVKNKNYYQLFNYGRVLIGNTLEEATEKMQNNYKSYNLTNLKYWKCKYM